VRIIIDIRDDLIVRWGSLFIHPLSYKAETVRMYTPGFEFSLNQQGAQAFSVKIASSPQQTIPQPMQQPQQSTRPPDLSQAPQSPQDYPPPQTPLPAQPPGAPQIPPEMTTQPPLPPYEPPQNTGPQQEGCPEPLEKSQLPQTSSQQPTPSKETPLSIVKSDNADDEAEKKTPGDQKSDAKDDNTGAAPDTGEGS